MHSSGDSRRGIAESCFGNWSNVIARATKQSTLTSRQHGLLRGACHRARIRATRWLAMTALYSTIAWLFEKLNRHVVPASAHGEAALLARIDPFRGASPQRVAMFGTEK